MPNFRKKESFKCNGRNITLYKPEIGSGRYATVYEGKWSFCNIKEEIVAIKIQHKENQIKTFQQKKRVIEEIRLHKRLNHPSIVKLKDAFEDKDNYYIVLEHCNFGSLDEYLEANKNILCKKEVYEIMKQVVDGLKYLHGKKIIHRDLSLKNILVAKDYETGRLEVKIADFGCSTELNTSDETKKTLVGTPIYMSPELAVGTEYSFGIDIWSLGVIFYTLLFGDFPFEGQSMQEVLAKIVLNRLDIPSTNKRVTSEARELLCLLLNKNSEERPDIYEISNHIYFKNNKEREFSSETQGQARSSKHKRGGNGANFLPTPYIPSQSGMTDSGVSSLNSERNSQKFRFSGNNEYYQPKQRSANSYEDTKSCLYKRMSSSNPDLVTRKESPSHFLSTEASYAYNSTKKSQCKRTSENVSAVEDRRKFLVDTIRLPPCELRKKNAIYKITAEGQAIAEYFKTIEQEKYIKYSLIVSSDGEKIGVFDPGDRNYTMDKIPDYYESIPPEQLYSFKNLPSKYWKKYKHIKNFVDFKRGKTPKIIIYTKEAKCSMMENFPDPDFELKFSEGWSIIKQRSKMIKLQNNKKETVTEENVSQKYLSVFDEMTRECHKLNDVLKYHEQRNEAVKTIFPAIFGNKAAYFQALKNSADEHCMSGKNKRVLQLSNSINSLKQKGIKDYKDCKEIYRREILNSVVKVLDNGDDVSIEYKDGFVLRSCNYAEEVIFYSSKTGKRFTEREWIKNPLLKKRVKRDLKIVLILIEHNRSSKENGHIT